MAIFPRSSLFASRITTFVDLAPMSMPATKSMLPPLKQGCLAPSDSRCRSRSLRVVASGPRGGALQGKQARPEGADKVRVRAHVELHAEFILQGPDHAGVSRNPSGEGHFGLDADTPHQGDRAGGDRAVNPAEDVFYLLALGQVGDDVGFEDR